MAEAPQNNRLSFDAFEFDVKTVQLYKNGHRIRLQTQPARLLLLLLTQNEKIVTRTDIQQALWPDGQFVEFEHAINTAIKKVREALDDDPENPKYIETLPKTGYRFKGVLKKTVPSEAAGSADDDFRLPHRPARGIFLFIQVGYLAMYCALLFNVSRLDGAMTRAGFVPVGITVPAILVVAMCGIAVRLYLIAAVGWRHPEARAKFLKLFPCLFVLDALWAVSPLIALGFLGSGPALAGAAAMAYLPFAQRTLIISSYE